MHNEKLKVIFEDDNLLVIDKPAGIVVFPEGTTNEKTLIDYLLEEFPALKNAGDPPRYGMVHRLDKDTSGILLVAKHNQALKFLQEQFQTGKVTKKYFALAVGHLKNDGGTIETLIGRSPKDRRKQKVYLSIDPKTESKRTAKTRYKVLQRFENYDLVEAELLTGRKHQIRTHFAHLGHPIAGDKLYGFKGQIRPDNLKRQFLHASYLKIEMPNGREREFKSELPQDLKETLNNLAKRDSPSS